MKPKYPTVLTKELLEKILDPYDMTWMRVPPYERGPVDGVGFFQQDYWTLFEHHMKETEFLIDLIQELARAYLPHCPSEYKSPQPRGEL